MLISTALVQLMTPGVALFYGGMVSEDATVSTVMLSFSAMGVVTVRSRPRERAGNASRGSVTRIHHERVTHFPYRRPFLHPLPQILWSLIGFSLSFAPHFESNKIIGNANYATLDLWDANSSLVYGGAKRITLHTFAMFQLMVRSAHAATTLSRGRS